MTPGKKSTGLVACVVTYNPGPELAGHLMVLREQVDTLVVVDNGSANAQWIARICSANDCSFIGNQQNLGIAAALNQAVQQARERGANWFAMFDQDSGIEKDFLSRLIDFAQSSPVPNRAGILAASQHDRVTRMPYHHPWDILNESGGVRLVRSTITSGSLVRMDLFDQIGLFDESLFIDSVDHDFCLRARRRGWQVVECCGLIMEHSIGAITVHYFLGLRMVCTNHNAQRRYYMTRNTLEVCRRNMVFDPRWSFKQLLVWVSGCMAVILWERDKYAKLAAIAQGAAHFLLRRFGKRP